MEKAEEERKKTKMDEEVNLLVESLKNCKVNDDTDKCCDLIEKLLLTVDNNEENPSQPPPPPPPSSLEMNYQQLIIDNVIEILQLKDNNPLQIRILKLIADESRNKFHRKHLTNEHLLLQLLKTLNELIWHDTEMNIFRSKFSKLPACINYELLIQVCRALGNIIYYNDDARTILINMRGPQFIFELLYLLELDSKNDVHKAFINARGGLISNLLLEHVELSIIARSSFIYEKIEKILIHVLEKPDSSDNLDDDSELIISVLSIVNVITDNIPEAPFNECLCFKIIEILDKTKLQEIFNLCLEILCYQAENDSVKVILASAGFCIKLYDRINTYTELARTNDAGHLVKMACDILVVILTGDESMKILYETKLLEYMVNWLDSKDPELLATGILALGNFSRSDNHCIYMVENKIGLKLIEILHAYNERHVFDLRMEHALLSTLRNLVIPIVNKEYMIKHGLVTNLLPLLKTQQPTVIFKLLGTLRMAIEGQQQTARDLLQNKFLISRLVSWSRESDFPSVSCESHRLMAWLIQHAFYARRNDVKVDGDGNKEKSNNAENPRSKIDVKLSSTTTTESTANNNTTTTTTTTTETESIAPIVLTSEECIVAFIKVQYSVWSMVNMITSPHLIMQNEALVALCIISALLDNTKLLGSIDLAELFIESKLGERLAEFLVKYTDTMTKEIVENLHTFIKLLEKSEKLVVHLKANNVQVFMRSLPIITEYCTL